MNGTADITPGVTGTLAVGNGGTGATTFTSGAAVIGNGTSAIGTRSITNMTSVGHIAYNTNLMTTNTLAYWNGAHASSGSSNLTYCKHGAFGTIVTKSASDYAAASHSHKYAGSSSAGGSANSAVKLDSSAGSATQPVYFSGGKPVACTYTISASVPSGAKFTDTVYTHPTTSGNKHIPSGGSSGQILGWSADGTAAWVNKPTSNTTGSTDTSSKIFLIGATSQAASPQTYSDNQVYATNGQLNGNTIRIGEKVTLQYNSSTQSLDFIFA